MATPRTTRSLARALNSPSAVLDPAVKRKRPETPTQTASTSSKRQKAELISSGPGPPTEALKDASPVSHEELEVAQRLLPSNIAAGSGAVQQSVEFIPATLPFSLDEAKDHLRNADSRFSKLFDLVKCKPYEDTEEVEPFRTLASSILGQQISWKAARAIKHKFIRLFDASLPETPPGPNEQAITFFPSPQQVSVAPVATLRTAGLSARKAEYVLDLAAHFLDGRLSAENLRTGSDEEVYNMLIAVKGIGPWTVEMFSMFSLRRGNILPCGDLGVQKGLLRWTLASHSLADAKKTQIAPHRLPGLDEGNSEVAENPSVSAPPSPQKETILPETDEPATSVLPAPNEMPVPPATPMKKRGQKGSTKTTAPTAGQPAPVMLLALACEGEVTPMSLPEGLTIPVMKSRLSGKKTKKGLYLTPSEMEHLVQSWAPYRSIGVWYMWSIVDEGNLN